MNSEIKINPHNLQNIIKKYSYCYNAILLLSSGEIFLGNPIGKIGKTRGELCFTTSMYGYQHTITDPSFSEQIIVFTTPHVGNVGINDINHERPNTVYTSGIVIKEYSEGEHPLKKHSLNNWMIEKEIVGIYGVDTRSLTNTLRKKGPQNGAIFSWKNESSTPHSKDLINYLMDCPQMKYRDLTLQLKQDFSSHKKNNEDKCLIVVDFGAKGNIVECVKQYLDGTNIEILIIKGEKDFAEKIINNIDKCAGILLSNGPGDPQKTCDLYAREEITKIIQTKIPVLGICLGHQMLALTLGCYTEKMPKGHRGANHPVLNIESNEIYITSQNHGFVVKEDNIPEDVEITYKSLFDNSIEGIKWKNGPVQSVQFHPEASPGPNDAMHIIKNFCKKIKN